MANSVHDLILWTDAARAPLMREVLDRLGDRARVAALAGPREPAIKQLADHLQLEAGDDLRQVIVQHPGVALLLADGHHAEPRHLRAAIEQHATVLSLEPFAATFDQLVALHHGADSHRPHEDPVTACRLLHVPAFLESPGYIGAGDIHELLGPPRALTFASQGDASLSLFARLFDAWRTLLLLADLPDAIDAAIVSAPRPLPESLRNATGHLTALARLPRQATAMLQISDRSPAPLRQLTVTTDDAQGVITDHTSDFLGPNFSDAEADGQSSSTAVSPPLSHTIADAIARPLEQPPAQPPTSYEHDRQALACSLATLLSARTGEPESPYKLLQLQPAGMK